MPKYIRLIILFDLVVCAAFALPNVSGAAIDLMNQMNALMAGGPALDMSPPAYFFVNFAGLLGVSFNALLLKTTLPTPHKINVLARFGVIILISYHLIYSGLPIIFCLFIVTELVGGVATLYWLKRAAHAG